jgi:hypothetical protein
MELVSLVKHLYVIHIFPPYTPFRRYGMGQTGTGYYINIEITVMMYFTLTIQLFCDTSINNMTTLLTTCTNEEQHAVIRFL